MKSGGKSIEEDADSKQKTSNSFSLNSIVSDTSQKFNIEIEFDGVSGEQGYASGTCHPSMGRKCKIPKFNRDGNYLTPSFVIQAEKCFFEFENEISQGGHGGRSEKSKDQNEGFMVPKPSSLYCRVCQTSFIDYLNHIKREDHISKMKRAAKKIKMSELITYCQHKTRKERRKTDEAEQKFSTKKHIVEDCCPETPVSLSRNTDTNNSSALSNRKKFIPQRLLPS